MLTFEQIKAIEAALGADKAAPIIQALETVESRVIASIVHDLATKTDVLDLKRDIEELRIAAQRDIRELELRLEARLADTNAKIEASKSDTIKWVAGMLVAQAALIATLVKLL